MALVIKLDSLVTIIPKLLIMIMNTYQMSFIKKSYLAQDNKNKKEVLRYLESLLKVYACILKTDT